MLKLSHPLDYKPSTTLKATYVGMTLMYRCLPSLSADTAGIVTYLIVRTEDGLVVDVPCTLVAAELIRMYDSGTLLMLYISPCVLQDDEDRQVRLLPLCTGAVRAV